MDKFLRALIISCLVVITVVLLGFEYVLSILPDQSKSGGRMIMLMWGCIALCIFLIVAFSRIGVKNKEDEIPDAEKKIYPNAEQELVSNPAREKSRVIFMGLIAIAMLAVLGIAAYSTGIF